MNLMPEDWIALAGIPLVLAIVIVGFLFGAGVIG